MKTQLIKLENFNIIISDEEIKERDLAYLSSIESIGKYILKTTNAIRFEELETNTMEVTQMTSLQAIDAMEYAIKCRDKKKILELYSPDDSEILPDWDNEPNYIWEEWEVLIEKAEQILGL